MGKADAIGHGLRKAAGFVKSPRSYFRADFQADGLAVAGKNLAFLDEPAFKAAWEFSRELNKEGWRGNVPDVRWRAHVACWSAKHCLSVPGDFAEFGVHTGIFSLTICKMHDFGSVPKAYHLFDTFNGIPLTSAMSDEERDFAAEINRQLYFDCFAIAQRNFSHFPNARLVRGILPQSLEPKPFAKLAFVHIDLNNSVAEMEVIAAIWDDISPGGIVLLDDYNFSGYEAQHEGWNAFCGARGHMVLSLPTGQGLIVRH
jgi:hypothetical protein